MKHISAVNLVNFKRFQKFSIKFNPRFNVLIGDNETGKSTILSAIDLVLSGSRSRIESYGLENIFNQTTINNFFEKGKKYEDLPKMLIEIVLEEISDPFFNGEIHSLNGEFDGVKLICIPDDKLGPEIKDVLSQPGNNFPFEYYSITFETFAGSYYSGSKKPLSWVMVDTSLNNSEYANREYVKSMYQSVIEGNEKAKHTFEYRKLKEEYNGSVLSDVNARVAYKFGVKNTAKANLESDLTVYENDVGIEYKGKGKQCFIKASFALGHNKRGQNVILLEEPENHLSHINMNNLILNIENSDSKQLLITTHNPFVCSRLDLRNVHIFSGDIEKPVTLSDIPSDVAKFFMKAPDNNLLEFILSKKVILVEGDSEYILMKEFYKKIIGRQSELDNVHVISVNGTGFKNYLHIAKATKCKVAVIRDNDKDYSANCIDNYSEYIDSSIHVFSDPNNEMYTFEVCVYSANKKACDDLFGKARRSKSVLGYMLDNKSEASFELLDKKVDEIAVPKYIEEACRWISI
jgi:putative ATP-dependent endonuclease of the OLD family